MNFTRRLATALLASMLLAVQPASSQQKISPYLQGLLTKHHTTAAPQDNSAGARLAAPNSQKRLKALLKLTPEASEGELMERYGFSIDQRIGRVLIVSIPLSQVAPLAACDQVLRIEAERPPRPMLDQVPRLIGSDKAATNEGQQLPQAFTGKDVVVGVVDAGFDYVNPFFRDANGTTRVAWAADYLTGTKLTSKAEITTAMHSSDAATMLHGTHVAGIAAGSRTNDINDVEYRGIAFEADIAEGTINSEITEEGLSSAYSLQAFSDIFAYAEEQGKPCVINYSLGDAQSFANNRQLEEEAIATLLQKPGRALVVAAGNSGSSARLAHKEASMSQAGAGVWFDENEQFGAYFGVELKIKPQQTVSLRLMNSSYRNTTAETKATGQELLQARQLMLGSYRLSVLQKGQSTDGYDVVYITAGLSTFSSSQRMLISIEGEGDAWIYADPLCAQLEDVPAYDNHSLTEQGFSMAWPAALDEVIAVGNIAHRMKIVTAANKYASQGKEPTPTDLTPYESTKGEGYLARSSSVGPTLDGRIKPDVCAPGVNIVSAYNNFVNEQTDMEYANWLISILDTEYEPDYGGYFVTLAQTGTSMSAPAVTGTIALWLQADPTLTTERIKDVIAHSSRQPDSELSYPNNQYGHGEIDAYRGLLYLLGLTDGIAPISMHQPQRATFRLQGRLLTVTTDAAMESRPTGTNAAMESRPTGTTSLEVYTTGGLLVASAKGQTTIDLSKLPSGVYAVQLNTGDRATTGSTLIRL